jgi:hypothetical protein
MREPSNLMRGGNFRFGSRAVERPPTHDRLRRADSGLREVASTRPEVRTEAAIPLCLVPIAGDLYRGRERTGLSVVFSLCGMDRSASRASDCVTAVTANERVVCSERRQEESLWAQF